MPKIEINIPKPCSANWSQMSLEQKGRFCHSCQKTVYDFTKLSDRAIVEKIATEPTLCGRFSNDQINRQLLIHKKKPTIWTAGIAGILSFLSTLDSKAYAQEKPQTVQTPVSEDFIGKAVVEPGRNLKISGTVSDQDTPIPAANVSIKNTSIRIQTDFNGKFEILARENDTLVFSYIGLETREIAVSRSKKPINIVLQVNLESEKMGEMVVVSKPGFFGRIYYSFRNLFR